MSQDLAMAGKGTVTLSRSFSLSTLLALFESSMRQFSRGRRLYVLIGLFALPLLFVAITRYFDPEHATKVGDLELVILFYFIPQVCIPLSALLLAGGIIRDEIEEQTLTYLLIRPVPRPAIYLAKLAAAWCMAAGLAAIFSALATVLIHWDHLDGAVATRAARLAILPALSLLDYMALFAAVSVVFRSMLTIGAAYVAIFEGLLANLDFGGRMITVLWHTRILAARWLDLNVPAWQIDLETAPSGMTSLLTLLISALVLSILGAFIFSLREYRMKTPSAG